MSYLSLPRLAFSGRFEADVSTVNNDVRHYDNASFEPRYQEPQQGNAANGWWNPSGTGAFRLVDVKVAQALSAPGSGASGDLAEGLYLNAQIERSAAKLVDLDPQFQLGSMIYGMRIALTDGKTEFMRGNFRPTAFRDLYFGRSPAPGSGGASAKFTSVLTDVEWDAAADRSPVLLQLKAAAQANNNKLSMNLMTYGFVAAARPFLGLVSGSIGAWETGQPDSFVAGRRFAAVGGSATPEGIGFFDAEVGDYVSLDLGNAMPLSRVRGEVCSVGELSAVVLKTPDTGPALDNGRLTVAAGIAQGAEIDADDMVELGPIDYFAPRWLQQTAGVVDFPIPDAAQGIIGDHPLALVSPVAGRAGRYKVMIRESIGGLFIRAEDFEARIDAPSTSCVTAKRTLHALRWGKPFAGAPIGLRLLPRASGQGGGFGTNQPTAPIPDINVPADSVRWKMPSETGPDGTAPVTFYASDPGNPRGYIDGQIFQIAYALRLAGASPMPQLDLFVLHVRDPFEVSGSPDWERDIEPFMKQYGNLYPVMSHDLFSLSDPKVAEQHARLLSFAFERPLDDPNHMPATRDLSDGKRRAVLTWLSQFIPGHAVAPAEARAVACPEEAPEAPTEGALQPMSDEAIDEALTALGEGSDGKTQAMREFLAAQRIERGER